MAIEKLIEYLPGLTVLISLIGLFGNFWQNYYANRLKIIEKTSDLITKFKQRVSIPFNTLIDLISNERTERIKEAEKSGAKLADSDFNEITLSVLDLHGKEILGLLDELNQLNYLLRSRYVNTKDFIEFTSSDISKIVPFLIKNNLISTIEIHSFLDIINIMVVMKMTEEQIAEKKLADARRKIEKWREEGLAARREAEIKYSRHVLPLPDWATEEGQAKHNGLI
ncbi:MAG: hypothetical protein LBM27_02080 [Lactobacillaceae bacterium]|jgi:hypothetical protein|nr:hypothetical protein [Lactobacillaceae bacterium]